MNVDQFPQDNDERTDAERHAQWAEAEIARLREELREERRLSAELRAGCECAIRLIDDLRAALTAARGAS